MSVGSGLLTGARGQTAQPCAGEARHRHGSPSRASWRERARGAVWLVLALAGCGAEGLPHGSTSAACGSCHPTQHQAWQLSGHSRSTASPVFSALVPRVEAAWGKAAAARCVACHAPGHGGDETIGCVSCHAAIGNRGEQNGALVVNLDAPLASSKRVVLNDAHTVRPRALLGSASLCGTCHEVHGPGLFDERTLTELRASDGEDSCLGCHGGDGHRFAGVDPAWGGTADERADADERARALWAKALELELSTSATELRVTLTNPGRHSVPTGVAILRDVWVDVEVRADDGAVFVERRALDLRATLHRGGVPVALITDASAVDDGALAAGASRTFTWTRPAGRLGPLEARAVLRARAVREEVVAALDLEARAGEVTTHEVAVRSARLPAPQ